MFMCFCVCMFLEFAFWGKDLHVMLQPFKLIFLETYRTFIPHYLFKLDHCLPQTIQCAISILSFISIPEQLIRPSPSIIGLVELITFVFVPPQRRHLIMGFFL